MKKQILNIGEALTRPQLKKINGGSGTCSACRNVQHVEVRHNVFADRCVDQVNLIENVSMSVAEDFVRNGGSWCCDSCGGLTWEEVVTVGGL